MMETRTIKNSNKLVPAPQIISILFGRVISRVQNCVLVLLSHTDAKCYAEILRSNLRKLAQNSKLFVHHGKRREFVVCGATAVQRGKPVPSRKQT